VSDAALKVLLGSSFCTRPFLTNLPSFPTAAGCLGESDCCDILLFCDSAASYRQNMHPTFEDRRLDPIWEKVRSQERLSFADGVTLYRTPDLLGLGFLANVVRERLHGNTTYFNVNRHINPTDVCVASCRLCAFGKKASDPKAYTWSHEEIWHRAGEGWTESITEFHIVGGLHPKLTLEWYCEMLRGLKERFPTVHLKAFTMVEIGYFARREKLPIREVLIRLRDAGMDSMPGGGAITS
jgi:aminodeoxyfutalosine synthase